MSGEGAATGGDFGQADDQASRELPLTFEEKARIVANQMHTSECQEEHVEHCGWFYEINHATRGMIPDLWQASAHKSWLQAARRRMLEPTFPRNQIPAAPILPDSSEYFENTTTAMLIVNNIIADLESGPLAHTWSRFTSDAQIRIRERWRDLIMAQL